MFLFNNGVYALSYIDADSNIPMFYDREEPHVNKMLAPGTGVDVLAVEKNWVYIWYKNRGGWVKSKYFPEFRRPNKLKRDIGYDSSTSFSKLWDEYGGSTLNFYGDGSGKKSNFKSKYFADTKAPIISLNQDNLTTVDSSNFNLSGFVKDDSSVSEVSIILNKST